MCSPDGECMGAPSARPEAELIITPDSGHSAFDPPNSRALIAATDKFAR